MKKTLRSLPSALTALLLVTGLTTITAAPLASVASFSGNVEITEKGGKTIQVKKGASIMEGQTIKTKGDGSVVLNLNANGGILSLRPNSVVFVNKLNQKKLDGESIVETKLGLRKGSVLGNVTKLSGASKYEVRTVKGVAKIKDASYEFTFGGDIKVSTGQLIFKAAKAKNVTVKAVNKINTSATPAKVTPLSQGETKQLLADSKAAGEATKMATIPAKKAPMAAPAFDLGCPFLVSP